MANAGDVLEMEPLGCRVQLIRTADETGGELVEFDVLGRPRGFLVQSHVHTGQVERYEVMARHAEDRRERAASTCSARARRWRSPPARRTARSPATSRPTATSASRSRPAGSTQAFLERVAAHVRGGRLQPLRLPQARSPAPGS